MEDLMTYPEGFEKIIENLDFLEDNHDVRAGAIMVLVSNSLFF